MYKDICLENMCSYIYIYIYILCIYMHTYTSCRSAHVYAQLHLDIYIYIYTHHGCVPNCAYLCTYKIMVFSAARKEVQGRDLVLLFLLRKERVGWCDTSAHDRSAFMMAASN